MFRRTLISIAALTLILVSFAGCRQNSFKVTAEQAKSIALEDAGVTADQVTWLNVIPDREDGKVVYDVSFYHGDTEYEYDIDAQTGKVLHKDVDTDGRRTTTTTPVSTATAPTTTAAPSVTTTTSNTAATTATVYITAEQAKAIALADAGLNADEVTRLYTEPDRDNDKSYLEVSFYHDHIEYDYKIDAVTGEIVEKDTDRD